MRADASRLPLAGLASQARLECRQQTCCGRALVARGEGVSARGPPAARSALGLRVTPERVKPPPPTTAADLCRPTTIDAARSPRAADRPDAAPSDHHRPPTAMTSLADAAAAVIAMFRISITYWGS